MRAHANPPAAGETVVWRDVFRGRVVFARPMRVVAAEGELLVCSLLAGTPIKLHSTYKSGQRKQYIEDLVTGEWTLQDAVWHSTNLLVLTAADAWYAVCLFFDARSGEFQHYYVNFQLPRRRTSIGFDTFDLCLDIVADARGHFRRKDEDEFARALELGLLSAEVERRVRAAADEVARAIEARRAPFDGRYEGWRPPAEPAFPAFPVGWQALETSTWTDQ